MFMTIDGFSDLTRQQMFDMSVKHVKANGPSVKGSRCTYSGSGCGASVFLKPEFHEAADEIGSWMALAAGKHVPPSRELTFVLSIQEAHDNAARHALYMRGTGNGDIKVFNYNWRKSMLYIAKRDNLNTDILEAIA